MNIIKQQKIREVATVFAVETEKGIHIVYEFDLDKGHFHDAIGRKGYLGLYGDDTRLQSIEDSTIIDMKFNDSFDCRWRSACAYI